MCPMEHFSDYQDHKCKITIGPDGNKLNMPKMLFYDAMSSSSKETYNKKSFEYLGEGDCISMYDNRTNKTVPLSGHGFFFKSKI
jgi:hypothetical protein